MKDDRVHHAEDWVCNEVCQSHSNRDANEVTSTKARFNIQNHERERYYFCYTGKTNFSSMITMINDLSSSTKNRIAERIRCKKSGSIP
ncbi:hypothetical protein AC249_AIPGENE14948 [Exaiptasia diaphana]|nr:hypothetical protein AC249_AIPGENE14948 [Exaiptasia diaphana]